MTQRKMEVILIPSTLCNLRCSYCYELDKLADKRRMSLESLAIVFERVARYFEQMGVDSARFIWHGGEPLLLPPEYYHEAFALQRSCFAGARTQIVNVTQTNLTVLDDARIELLRDGFDSCGVSLDLFGSLRVNKAGKCQEDRALANLERARAAGVLLGGVTVLTRANRSRVRSIFEFYRERDMAFRLLPLHAGDFRAGQWFEIGAADALRAFRELADLWLDAGSAPPIHPVTDIIEDVFRFHADGRRVGVYDKATWDPMIAIDREGFVSSYDDIHDRSKGYGNILSHELSEVLDGATHRAVIAHTGQRAAEACGRCAHYGASCTGFGVVEGARDYWGKNADGSLRCEVFAGLIAHIEQRLSAAGVRLREPSTLGLPSTLARAANA
ncbi:MAG TPA: radical SAM protein [Polyangiaceae bacterium]|jgi:uncharacterized protein|nr:radical SAM protein [Polyangiaceae bacterium]